MRACALVLSFALMSGAASSEPIDTGQTVAAPSGDFNRDGSADLAMIVEPETGKDMDLHVLLGDKTTGDLRPGEVLRGKITGRRADPERSGLAPAIAPKMSLLADGSIRLFVAGPVTGSPRTNETLTLAHRAGRLIVTSFAYDFQDFSKFKAAERCRYNVITGKGTNAETDVDGQWSDNPVDVEGQVVAFADWDFSIGIEACGD